MIWWFRARRWHLLVFAFGIYFVLLLITRNRQIVLPNLNLGSISLALAAWLPVLPTVCFVVCLESRIPAAEISGTRYIDRLDVVASISTAVTATILGIIVTLSTGATDALSAGRNTAFLVGLTLTVRSVVGMPAVIAPVLWPVTVSLVGFHGRSQPYHWTILPERPFAWYAAVGAVLALATGIVAQYVTARKPT